MVCLIRFAPGMRVALAAACAYAGVSPLKFSLLNSLSALVWAVTVLTLVARVGPASLAALGVSGWRAALCVGLVVIAVLQAVGWVQRRLMLRPDGAPHVQAGDSPGDGRRVGP
jgi:membrane protein DedA with SNARE-associated domain